MAILEKPCFLKIEGDMFFRWSCYFSQPSHSKWWPKIGFLNAKAPVTELELVSASSSGLWLMYTTDDGHWELLDLWFVGHLCGSNHKGLRICSLEFTWVYQLSILGVNCVKHYVYDVLHVCICYTYLLMQHVDTRSNEPYQRSCGRVFCRSPAGCWFARNRQRIPFAQSSCRIFSLGTCSDLYNQYVHLQIASN